MTALLLQNVQIYFMFVGLACTVRYAVFARKDQESKEALIVIVLMLIVFVLSTIAGHNIE